MNECFLFVERVSNEEMEKSSFVVRDRQKMTKRNEKNLIKCA